MSKSSQRRKSAYRDGYELGRNLKDCGYRWLRYGGLSEAFNEGYHDGKRDRAIAILKAERKLWYNRVISWICQRAVG